MNRSRIRSGGFVYAELALALPCLALLTYGLALVGGKIFDLGKRQLADYLLEEEVHDVLSRLMYDARVAHKVDFTKSGSYVKFIYPTVDEAKVGDAIYSDSAIAYKDDVRVYKLDNSKIYYERQGISYNPITGENYFGETQVTEFKVGKSDKADSILHVTLEMTSKDAKHKIKINTAVYMPACKPEDFKVIE